MSNQNLHESSLTNHDAEVYRKNASFVFSEEAIRPILAALNAQAGERIVDLGCGSGELTKHLGELVGATGSIVGIDSSPDMLAKATALTASSNNIRYLPPIDIQSMPTPLPGSIEECSFDAVFSSAVLHWCKRDPAGVLEGCKRLLKPNGQGRLVIEMGGHMNMIGVRGSIRAALERRGIKSDPLDPWFFPSAEQYKQLLVDAGLKPISLELVPRPTPLPTGLRGWLETFVRHTFLAGFQEDEANALTNEVVRDCEVDCKDWKGQWTVMYTRLRIVATT